VFGGHRIQTSRADDYSAPVEMLITAHRNGLTLNREAVPLFQDPSSIVIGSGWCGAGEGKNHSTLSTRIINMRSKAHIQSMNRIFRASFEGCVMPLVFGRYYRLHIYLQGSWLTKGKLSGEQTQPR